MPDKLTNHNVKVSKIVALDFEKECILSGTKKRDAQEQAMKDWIKKKKVERQNG